MALVPFGALLYPAAGLLALGAGLAIPSVTSEISNRTPELAQGRLMGGIQAVLSLAGLAFDHVGIPAPYLLGGLLTRLALLVAAKALLGARHAGSRGSNV